MQEPDYCGARTIHGNLEFCARNQIDEPNKLVEKQLVMRNWVACISSAIDIFSRLPKQRRFVCLYLEILGMSGSTLQYVLTAYGNATENCEDSVRCFRCKYVLKRVFEERESEDSIGLQRTRWIMHKIGANWSNVQNKTWFINGILKDVQIIVSGFQRKHKDQSRWTYKAHDRDGAQLCHWSLSNWLFWMGLQGWVVSFYSTWEKENANSRRNGAGRAATTFER